MSLTLKMDIKLAACSIVCKFFLALNFSQDWVFNYKSHKLCERIYIKRGCGINVKVSRDLCGLLLILFLTLDLGRKFVDNLYTLIPLKIIINNNNS